MSDETNKERTQRRTKGKTPVVFHYTAFCITSAVVDLLRLMQDKGHLPK